MQEYTRVSEILSLFKDFSMINPSVLKNKANIGTEVHRNIHMYKTNNFETFDLFPVMNPEGTILRYEERGKGYFNSFLQYDKEHKMEFDILEERFYDDDLMITGQIDGLMKKNNQLMLVDFKTSAQADLKIWNMQAHLYKYLLNKNNIEVCDTFLFLKLNKDGKQPEEVLFTFDEAMLSYCLDAVEYYREIKRDAKDD